MVRNKASMEKFLSLDSDKQNIFALEVERLGERPVVVTAERARIAVFCGRRDGSWVSFVRAHAPLSRTPRRPDRSHMLGWSRRIGVASQNNVIALVYRRRFPRPEEELSDSGELWIDCIRFNPNKEDLSGAKEPVAVPRRKLDIAAFGLCVWADCVGDRLFIVAQAFPTLDESASDLVLLSAPFPMAEGSELTLASNWSVKKLDSGGWDFDVRREKDRLFVVHRRTAAAYTTDVGVSAFPDLWVPPPIILSDEPGQFEKSLDDMAIGNLVLVEALLPDGAVQSADETLPFGELPRIHRVDPFIVTMERMKSARVEFRLGDRTEINQVTVTHPQWRTFLTMVTPVGWRAASLLDEPRDWPSRLRSMADANPLLSMISLRVGEPFPLRIARLQLAALFPDNPVSLFKQEKPKKDWLLTFAHRDAMYASLRVTTFRVVTRDDGETLVARAEAFSTLDIGHRPIRSRRDAPIEHERFEPFSVEDTKDHEDGYSVTRNEAQTANILAWGLAAADVKPLGFYAYADMGDGGARVVFDYGFDLPPPKGGPPDGKKAFLIETVPEPVQAGTAWVGLKTPSLIDTELTGYLALPWPPPRSLACDLQPALDNLPLAAVSAIEGLAVEESPLRGGGELVFREGEAGNPGSVESVLLTRETANEIEEVVVSTGNFILVESENDQPFPIKFTIGPRTRFASRPVEFRASVPGFAADGFTFAWTFSDGSSNTGRLVDQSFEATLPDMSTADPLAEPGDPIEVTLTVTAPDGQISTASDSFELSASFWATVWEGFAAFRRRPDDEIDPEAENPLETVSPGFFATDVTVDLFRYHLEYTTSSAGEGLTVRITYKDVHAGRFQFVEPEAPGQGDTYYEVPIDVSLSDVHLTGDLGSMLGAIVEIESVEARLLYSRRFQACVQTSERRKKDVTSDTVVERAGEEPVMTASALCCVPVGDTTLALAPGPEGFKVACKVTDAARNLAMLVAALVVAGLAVIVLAILVPILIIVAPAAIVPALISIGLSVIVDALVAAGVALVAVLLLEIFVIRPQVELQIREGLTDSSVRENFDDSGLFDYAGEGLAEALAVHLIRKAKSDGHLVAEPMLSGRDRFRPNFFEVIAVEAGQCKAKIRFQP